MTQSMLPGLAVMMASLVVGPTWGGVAGGVSAAEHPGGAVRRETAPSRKRFPGRPGEQAPVHRRRPGVTKAVSVTVRFPFAAMARTSTRYAVPG